MTGYTLGSPSGALRGEIGAYVGYVEHAPTPLPRREFAVSRCVLVIGWGEPLDVVDPRDPRAGATGVTSFAAGLSDSYVDTLTAAGHARGVQVMLDPLVAGRLLGCPFGELANRVVPLSCLDGRASRDLRALPSRLSAARTWPERFALLDAAFTARLSAAPPPDPRIAGVWHRLRATGGAVPVETLATEAGWTRRHLTTLLRRELGLPPKTLGRLLRFERAYAQTRRAAVEGWAAVAADAGYYDQAHLIRDFRAFTGSTPAQLATTAPPGPAHATL